MIQGYLKSDHLLGLQGIEGFVEDIIIPFIGGQFVGMVDDGESIYQVGAQEGVHILWHVLPITRPVLGPVGEVTHHLVGRCCVGVKGTLRKHWLP